MDPEILPGRDVLRRKALTSSAYAANANANALNDNANDLQSQFLEAPDLDTITGPYYTPSVARHPSPVTPTSNASRVSRRHFAQNHLHYRSRSASSSGISSSLGSRQQSGGSSSQARARSLLRSPSTTRPETFPGISTSASGLGLRHSTPQAQTGSQSRSSLVTQFAPSSGTSSSSTSPQQLCGSSTQVQSGSQSRPSSTTRFASSSGTSSSLGSCQQLRTSSTQVRASSHSRSPSTTRPTSSTSTSSSSGSLPESHDASTKAQLGSQHRSSSATPFASSSGTCSSSTSRQQVRGSSTQALASSLSRSPTTTGLVSSAGTSSSSGSRLKLEHRDSSTQAEPESQSRSSPTTGPRSYSTIRTGSPIGITRSIINARPATTGRARVEAPDSSMIQFSTRNHLQFQIPDQVQSKSTIFCAISESRSGDVVGVAIFNLSTAEAELSRILNEDKFQYSGLIQKLRAMENTPQCFILLHSVIDPSSTSRLAPCLRAAYPRMDFKPLDRNAWSEADGLERVRRFALEDQRDAILSALDRNFYVSCAFAAVMTYIESSQGFNFAPYSVNIKYAEPANTLRLDRVAVAALELVGIPGDGRAKASTLFGLMDQTLSPQGRRLLRTTVLQPSCNEPEIMDRLDAVEELTAKEEFLQNVCKCLKALHRLDIERIVAWILRDSSSPAQYLEAIAGSVYSRSGVELPSHEDLQVAEWELNYTLMLREYLEGIAALQATLVAEGCSSRLLGWVEGALAPGPLSSITGLLREGIDQNTGFSMKPIDLRNNRIWALRALPGSGLEKARSSYREQMNRLYEYVDELNGVLTDYLGKQGTHRMDSDHVPYLVFPIADVKRSLDWAIASGQEQQFEFTLPQAWDDRFDRGSPIFFATRRRSSYYIQTEVLMHKGRLAQFYADVATTETDRDVVMLKAWLRKADLRPVYTMIGAVAMLDMVCSFAQLSTSSNYVRPHISNQLVLQGARNPILETRKKTLTPNDVYFGINSHRCLVLTGGNMTGKSTLVKMIGLIQIMAQMGSFVPADYAAIPVTDRIFARLSTEDKPENNLGTFAVEMSDMNLMLRHATSRSLVLIDELGRGTSRNDGLALAMAMSLKLLVVNTRLVFATHFPEIGPALRARKEQFVTCVHFVGHKVAPDESAAPEITLTHKLAPGPIQDQDYGIDLSRRFLPEPVVTHAYQISAALDSKNGNKNKKDIPVATVNSTQRRLILGVDDVLQRLEQTPHGDSARLATELANLQDSAKKMQQGPARTLTRRSRAPASHAVIRARPATAPGRPSLAPSYIVQANPEAWPPLPQASSPHAGGHAAQDRKRWVIEENRVMQANRPLPIREKRSRENEVEGSPTEAYRPRRVFRGGFKPAMRGSETDCDGSPEPPELSRQLDEAREKLRAWEREDGLQVG